MQDNRYLPFYDTGLPNRFRKAFEFSKEAHFRGYGSANHPLLYGQFHPVALAASCRDLNLPAYAVEAAILHDVIEMTPVDYDHIEAVFDMEVSELVYEFSMNKAELHDIDNLTIQTKTNQLAGASKEAQIIKQLDILQTIMFLGSSNPTRAVEFAQWACPMSKVMDKVPSPLRNRVSYICGWAKRREYEARVNAYQHPKAHEQATSRPTERELMFYE